MLGKVEIVEWWETFLEAAAILRRLSRVITPDWRRSAVVTLHVGVVKAPLSLLELARDPHIHRSKTER